MHMHYIANWMDARQAGARWVSSSHYEGWRRCQFRFIRISAGSSIAVCQLRQCQHLNIMKWKSGEVQRMPSPCGACPRRWEISDNCIAVKLEVKGVADLPKMRYLLVKLSLVNIVNRILQCLSSLNLQQSPGFHQGPVNQHWLFQTFTEDVSVCAILVHAAH